MIGQHITLDGDRVTTEYAIIPDYILESIDSDCPQSDIDFGHWFAIHFDNREH